MFHTARTSARTMLVAAGAAGFVALGAGIAGAHALGGATEGLPPGVPDSRVPAILNDGVTSPLGELAKADPGEISAQPGPQHQSSPAGLASPADARGTVVGDSVSAGTPFGASDEATTVGPLDFDSDTGAVPLSGGTVDPLSGLGLMDGLDLNGGQSLPLSYSESPLRLGKAATVAEDTVTELGSRAATGVHESDPRLVELDEVDIQQMGEVVPMSAPAAVDTAENSDLTGGSTAPLPRDVSVRPQMSGSEELTLEHAFGGGVADVIDPARGLGLPQALDGALAMSAAERDLLGEAPASPSGDLAGVNGLPELGESGADTGQLPVNVPAGDDMSIAPLPLVGDLV